MKRLIVFLMMFVLIFTLSLAGCKEEAAETVTEEAAPEEEAEAAPEEEAEEVEEEAVEEVATIDPEEYPLGMVMILKGHPVVQIMETGFLDRAKELGYPAKLLACDEYDAQKAISLGEAGIAEGLKGMVIYIIDDSVKPLIKKAADAGIKVVTAHTVVEQEDYPGLLAWAAADAEIMGAESAEAIASQVGGMGTVAVTQGSFNPVENMAAEGFINYMEENYPDIKVLEAVEEGFDPAIAVSRAVAIIQANDDLVGAFSTTGSGPSTWAGAQDQTEQKLVCIGMDYSRQNLDLVKSGEIYGIVAQPLFDEFAFCVDMLDSIFKGETVEFDNYLSAPVVTIDDLDKYYEYLDIVDEAFAEK